MIASTNIRSVLGSSVFALSLFVSAPLLAQSNTGDAQRLGREAAAAFEDGDLHVAADLYMQALEHVADPSFAYNLGAIYDSLGDLPLAQRYFEMYLELFPGADDRAEIRSYLNDVQADLEENYAQLVVTSEPTMAYVSRIDDEDTSVALGQTPIDTWIAPGSVTVEVSAEGYETWTGDYNGVAGVRLLIDADLVSIDDDGTVVTVEPLPGETGSDISGGAGSAVPGYVLIGAGVASVGAGVVFLMSGGNAASDQRDLVASIGVPGTSVSRTEIEDLESQATSRTSLGSALSIGGAALATGGLVYLLLRGGSETSDSASRSGASTATRPSQGLQIVAHPLFGEVNGVQFDLQF